VIDEQHHRFVLVVAQRHEVQALSDLDLGVLEPLR
jgi:hypothetical protein